MARIPKYRLHKSTGRAAVTLGGRHIYLGPYGSKESWNKYHRLVSEFIACGSSPAFGKNPDAVSLNDVLLAYMRYAKAYYGTGPASEFLRFRPIVKLATGLYGDDPCSTFTNVQFKSVREALMKPIKLNHKNKTITVRSRKYVNKCMERLLRIFKWAAGEGLIKAEVYASLKLIDSLRPGRTKAPETAKILLVPHALVEKTLPILVPVVADMVRFQMLVGCRPGEVCQIQPAMVDRSKDVWTIKLVKHKTAWKGKERIIYVGPKAQAVLTPYLERGADKFCFSPKEADKRRRLERSAKRKSPLNQGNKPGYNERIRAKENIKRRPGLCYAAGTYGRSIRASCLRNNIEPWAPNRLRHLAATDIRAASGLEAAQVLLGHSSADITQVFAETSAKLAIDTIRKIG